MVPPGRIQCHHPGASLNKIEKVTAFFWIMKIFATRKETAVEGR